MFPATWLPPTRDMALVGEILPGGGAARPRILPVAGLLPGFRSAGWSVWLLTMVWAGWHGWHMNSNDLGSAKCATVEIAPKCVWEKSL